jgi:hypothetical protein
VRRPEKALLVAFKYIFAALQLLEFRVLPYVRSDHEISRPFKEKSEAWTDAMHRRLVKVIRSPEEDPPRRILYLKYAIVVH